MGTNEAAADVAESDAPQGHLIKSRLDVVVQELVGIALPCRPHIRNQPLRREFGQLLLQLAVQWQKIRQAGDLDQLQRIGAYLAACRLFIMGSSQAQVKIGRGYL